MKSQKLNRLNERVILLILQFFHLDSSNASLGPNNGDSSPTNQAECGLHHSMPTITVGTEAEAIICLDGNPGHEPSLL